MTLFFHDLAFERNNNFLFSRLTHTLCAGELLQIHGANGSGKSTLLRILSGFLEPTVGKIDWCEKSIALDRHFYQQQLHYIGHRNAVKEYLTVYENIKMNAALLAVRPTDQDVKNILDKIGLQKIKNHPALHLSAGQLRRLSLAKLLLVPKSFWVLDEPAAALDAEGQQLLSALLQQHLQSGGLAVLALHQNLPLIGKIKKISLGEYDA